MAIDPKNLYIYRIILKSGTSIEMTMDYNLSQAMEKPGYFNGAIMHGHDRVWDVLGQKCILYGEIAGWTTVSLPESDTYPDNYTEGNAYPEKQPHELHGTIETEDLPRCWVEKGIITYLKDNKYWVSATHGVGVGVYDISGLLSSICKTWKELENWIRIERA